MGYSLGQWVDIETILLPNLSFSDLLYLSLFVCYSCAVRIVFLLAIYPYQVLSCFSALAYKKSLQLPYKDSIMTVYSAQRPAPRAPRFSEVMESPTKKLHVESGPPAYTEVDPRKNELEEAKRRIRDMALSMPTTTEVVPAQTEEMHTQDVEKAKTPTNKLLSQDTAGSSRVPEWKRQASLRPKVPSLSSNMSGDDLDIAFRSLPLRPEMKRICDMRKGRKCAHVPRDESDESPIFICLDCKDRPICEACIRDVLANPADPHQANHYLHPWKATSSLQFDKFLWERRHGARLHFGPKEMLGREWLYSDHSFAPSSIGNLTVRFVLNAEPGIYYVSVGVRTYVNPASISRDKLGKSNYSMIKAGMTWIGSLGVGVQTVDREATTSRKGVNRCLQRLPDKIVEQEVKRGTENEEVVSPSGTVQVFEGQVVEVSIRHWHDKGIFKKGSPFKWWLDSIT